MIRTLLLALFSAAIANVTCAQDPVTVHVDINHADASDVNDGSSASPLRSISAAVSRAVSFKKARRPTTVLIHPGVYREGPIKFGYTNWSTNDPENQTPIVVQATNPGEVFIRGSEIFDGWQATGEDGVFFHVWENNWGAAPNPWSADRKVAEIVLRREMVFVDGKRLEQVLTQRELASGRFYVDESADRLFVSLGVGADPRRSLIEVALRSRLWDQNYENNVTIRGLVFEHAATPWDPADAAVWISGAKNVLVEACEVRETNWQGLYFGESSGVTIRSTRMNNNGGQGWGMFRVSNLTAIGNETSYNNWRGEQGGFTGWSVGNKLLSVHGGLIRGHVAIGNFSRGLWLDYDISEVVLDSLELRENTRDGLWIEASQGPVTVKNSRIEDNRESGIRSTYSRLVVVDSNRIAGNELGQIEFDGTGVRSVRNFATGEQMSLTLRDWVITHNTIEGRVGIRTGDVFKRSDWRELVGRSVIDENRYGAGGAAPTFNIVKGKWSFSEWTENTGHDKRSTVGS